eukprot:355049-Chlamydomonas_euryale.AAC.2
MLACECHAMHAMQAKACVTVLDRERHATLTMHAMAWWLRHSGHTCHSMLIKTCWPCWPNKQRRADYDVLAKAAARAAA